MEGVTVKTFILFVMMIYYYLRKLETRRLTPPHLEGKAEAEVATCKAFIGPPEVRGKGHSGLSEDITDQALSGQLHIHFNLSVTLSQMGANTKWRSSSEFLEVSDLVK